MTAPQSATHRHFLGVLLKSPLLPAAALSLGKAGAATAAAHLRVLMNDAAVAGLRYDEGERAIRSLKAGDRLILRREPANPHDTHAVEVLHGRKLGCVPRYCNRHLSRLRLERVPLICETASIDRDGPISDMVWVRVLLPVADSAGAAEFASHR